MGNNQPAGRGGDEAGMKGLPPPTFHTVHSTNIELSADRRCARRIDSFCKGVCFSARPVTVGERVYLKFAAVSTSWSGALRFGVMNHDPVTLNAAELPRYACPDLTNKPGYWAKGLPERYSAGGNVLLFYVTRNGDVMFGVNGEEKGVLFSNVNTSKPLWCLIDIYGNTLAMEFVDGSQAGGAPVPATPLSALAPTPAQNLSLSNLSISSKGSGNSIKAVCSTAPAGSAKFHQQCQFAPLPFHVTKGRNVSLSVDKMSAMRHADEFCNAYVFSHRPLRVGEKVVVQVNAVDPTFCGSLAFGLTSCDPALLGTVALPDDADLLLDRPEYWVVNKDVCARTEVGDELSFMLSQDGEVRFGRNGMSVATLMHVDTTLPLWMVLDVYGNTQKVTSLGSIVRGAPTPHPRGVGSHSTPQQQAVLTVALPPPRGHSAPSTPTTTSSTPPPRPPPPPRHSPLSLTRKESPPLLPPKHSRPLPAPPPTPGTMLTPTPAARQSLAHRPLPAEPQSLPDEPCPPPSPPHTTICSAASLRPTSVPCPPDIIPPPRPPPSRPTHSSLPRPTPPLRVTDDASRRRDITPPLRQLDQPRASIPSIDQSGATEAADNAANECSVCLERGVDSVLYTCGHMCMCYECACEVKASASALCPICRQTIIDVIRTFRS